MGFKVENLGAVAYGGAVTATTWWDNKRIQEAKLTSKDVLKKASFYTYLGVGLVATLMNVFNWMPRYSTWAENVSIGFLYDMPRFLYDLTKTLGAQGAGRSAAQSAAVRQAQQILAANRQLAAGNPAGRTLNPEFNVVNQVAW